MTKTQHVLGAVNQPQEGLADAVRRIEVGQAQMDRRLTSILESMDTKLKDLGMFLAELRAPGGYNEGLEDETVQGGVAFPTDEQPESPSSVQGACESQPAWQQLDMDVKNVVSEVQAKAASRMALIYDCSTSYGKTSSGRALRMRKSGSSGPEVETEMSRGPELLAILQEKSIKKQAEHAKHFMVLKKWAHSDPEYRESHSTFTLGYKPLVFLRRVMKDGTFDLVFSVVIVLNALVMMFKMEADGQEILKKVDLHQPKPFAALDNGPPVGEAYNKICIQLNAVFLGLFILELGIRFLIERHRFFCNAWHILDFIIVSLTFCEVVLDSMTFNPSLLRLGRLLRLAPMLRIIRAIQSFRLLRILARTIIASIQGLLWSIVLLSIWIIMGGIVIGQTTQGYLDDPAQDDEVRKFVLTYFGTLGRCIFTIFQWTLGGNVPHSTRQLIEDVSHWFAIFVVIYTLSISFALVRVIGAIFIKETLASAQHDSELVIEETLKNKNQVLKDLQDLFQEFDSNQDGMLDQSEFHQALNDERLRARLSALDLNVQQTAGLFTLMDNGTGHLSCDELIAGAVRLRGDAKTIDVVTLMYETKKVTSQIQRLQEMMELCVNCSHQNACALDVIRKQSTSMRSALTTEFQTNRQLTADLRERMNVMVAI